MHIYYLTVFMGLESGYGLNGFSSSGYLRDCNQGISWGDIYLQVWLGRICFQAHLVVVGRTQFLVGFWTESLSSSLAVGQRLPSVPCKLGCSIGQLITWKLVSSNWMRERGEREMMNKMEISPVFYSLLHGGGREGLHREGVDIRRPSLGTISEAAYSTSLLDCSSTVDALGSGPNLVLAETWIPPTLSHLYAFT